MKKKIKFLNQIYVVGTQKNHLDEMVLLTTKNTYLDQRLKKATVASYFSFKTNVVSTHKVSVNVSFDRLKHIYEG